MFFDKSKGEDSVHFVNGRNLYPPYPEGTQQAVFGMGCFWGAERCFWNLPECYVTAVGYAGGQVANPSYQQVCSGTTGHIEVVLVVYEGAATAYGNLLKVFWQANDPTQGMRSGNDVGEQYQSVIFCADEQQYQLAIRSRSIYQNLLDSAGCQKITTDIAMAPAFYYAEDYHQQYLAKNPDGYCGLKGLGIAFPTDHLLETSA